MSFTPNNPSADFQIKHWLPMQLFGPIMASMSRADEFEMDPGAGAVEARRAAMAVSAAAIATDGQLDGDALVSGLTQGAMVRVMFVVAAAAKIAEGPQSPDNLATKALAAATAMWLEFKDNLPD